MALTGSGFHSFAYSVYFWC